MLFILYMLLCYYTKYDINFDRGVFIIFLIIIDLAIIGIVKTIIERLKKKE